MKTLVELGKKRGPEDLPGRGGGRYVARAELVLARPDHRQLTAPGLDPDPLQMMAAACAQVGSERGEEAELVVDLVPVSGWRVARWRRRLIRQAQSRGPSAYGRQLGGSGGGGGWWSALSAGLTGGGGSPSPGRKAVPRKTDLAEGVGKFLPTADMQVFAVQVLIRVSATHPSRAQARQRARSDPGSVQPWQHRSRRV
ncbi:hypothetical protein AMK17_38075 [Streptomyces sp. CB00072]|uniref:hypothetical protein n=1 Tax=Streptomyces sp. CB00072 TaxID=1703928 RepID=UPI000939085F|nr:hypothetical protein [Streptomyces sp. CB00072]OKI49457.1 hypothetical protein AMK17_38075 [Streptomyces sp. CB00072]